MFNPEKSNFNSQETPPQPKELPEQDFEVGAKSVASEDHPERNEDAMLQLPEKKIFGVFDGVGGEVAGETASKLASDYIAEAWKKLPEELSLEETQEALKKILQEANERILTEMEKHPDLAGMATTASVVKILEGKEREKSVIIGNVGDSRVYIYHVDGRLEQVTIDDSTILNVTKDEREIRKLQKKLSNVTDPSTLPEEEQQLFRGRNIILRWLGMEGLEPRIYTVDIKSGDQLIITSDGIPDNLTDKEMAAILDKEEGVGKTVQDLIEASLNRSRELGSHPRAKPDDMTALVVEFKKAKPEKEVSIAEAQDFAELFAALERTGGLQGTQKFYTPKELKERIRKVVRGELGLDNITNVSGLRDKALELWSKEYSQRKG